MANKKIIKKAVLPVAGFGTRFYPITRTQPKEMLPIVDKPVVQYIIQECIDSGIEEIIFITGRNKRAIEDHFDYLPEIDELMLEKGLISEMTEFEELRKKVNFIYVRQDKQLGNGHALLCAKSLIKDEPFVFCNADDLIYAKLPAIQQMIEEYNKNEIIEEMVGFIEVKRDQINQCGIMELMHQNNKEKKILQIKQIIEKPPINKAPSNYANPGRYILTKDIFQALEETKPGHGGEIWISDAFNRLGKLKSLYGCRIEGVRYDCGNKLEYLKAVIKYSLKNQEIGYQFSNWLKKINKS
jgi:UTP--glucose-1-phosphate uridylyltransferase